MSVIEVRDLHKSYPNHVAVQNVSFSVEPGEIFGIIGPNGAGKTTTVECIEGLRTPDGGSIEVLGLDPQRDRVRLRHLIGVQLQESALPEKATARESLELYSSFYRNPVDWRPIAEDLGLTDKLNTRYGKLSGGQKQRLSIALSLVGNPKIAFLDELTTGLDPQARRDTWEVIESVRQRGVTIVLVTHFMEEAERLCDRLALIDRGRVVAVDSPGGLIEGVQAEQRIRFETSAPIEDRVLTDLPEVTGVTRQGSRLLVTGTGDLLRALTSALAAIGVRPVALRVEQASLEDAFVALTGHRSQNEQSATAGSN
ncbi:ABC transporter ATP-binding protein [Actinoalloteichus hymeniacidonis]|uniref:ABC-type multidrug transport system, ATPase component n=1 Tax=Actinoalloteichus hymeniacidonis TaxID=340345 RepID=A0AAC9HTX6_9PSEU|nr:ABC transporter ATP-binding protein [Actinoalloteichus hymeniacidonis]AOS65051.1 ABC-type multidrug transport system, ATPase component [Actinoalloteichus hymeniacidonis]MBB5906870.1 ABC-2 type transport system ATP-binding protein [Actinoalloteichus hymeniacidonis]